MKLLSVCSDRSGLPLRQYSLLIRTSGTQFVPAGSTVYTAVLCEKWRVPISSGARCSRLQSFPFFAVSGEILEQKQFSAQVLRRRASRYSLQVIKVLSFISVSMRICIRYKQKAIILTSIYELQRVKQIVLNYSNGVY